jgi:hypothetical protein
MRDDVDAIDRSPSADTRSRASTLVLAFVLGVAAGAVTALLTASRTGRETRRRLKTLAGEAGAEAARLTPALGEAFARAVRAARDAFVDTLRVEGVPLGEEAAGRPTGPEREH